MVIQRGQSSSGLNSPCEMSAMGLRKGPNNNFLQGYSVWQLFCLIFFFLPITFSVQTFILFKEKVCLWLNGAMHNRGQKVTACKLFHLNSCVPDTGTGQ